MKEQYEWKKIALKEQVAEARAHLDRQKSKYYEDIKAGSKLTQEQQKAIDFFNRYNKESEQRQKISEASKMKFRQKLITFLMINSKVLNIMLETRNIGLMLKTLIK